LWRLRRGPSRVGCSCALPTRSKTSSWGFSGAQELYAADIHAFVVLSNHMHVLLTCADAARLGLSISLKGVKASGGEIRVRDLPGAGCVFTVDLPRAPAP
jgi:hypothetical protein